MKLLEIADYIVLGRRCILQLKRVFGRPTAGITGRMIELAVTGESHEPGVNRARAIIRNWPRVSEILKAIVREGG